MTIPRCWKIGASLFFPASEVYQSHALGSVGTPNNFQSHPYQFARQIFTLHHISNGRIVWNIVTGTQDNGSRNIVCILGNREVNGVELTLYATNG